MKINLKKVLPIFVTFGVVILIIKFVVGTPDAIKETIPLNTKDAKYSLLSIDKTKTRVVQLNPVFEVISTEKYAGIMKPVITQESAFYFLSGKSKIYLYENQRVEAIRIFSSNYKTFFANTIANDTLFYITRSERTYKLCEKNDCTYFNDLGITLDEDTHIFSSLNYLDGKFYIGITKTNGEQFVYIVDQETKTLLDKKAVVGDLFIVNQQLYAKQNTITINDSKNQPYILNDTNVLYGYDANLNHVKTVNLVDANTFANSQLTFLNSFDDIAYFMITKADMTSQIMAYDLQKQESIVTIDIADVEANALLKTDVMFDFSAKRITILKQKSKEGFHYDSYDFSLNKIESIISEYRLVDIIYH